MATMAEKFHKDHAKSGALRFKVIDLMVPRPAEPESASGSS